MLLACQGFVYDGPAGLIGFKPIWQPDGHVSFFTAAQGWGLFTQRRKGNMQTELIELRYGKVRVASLIFQASEETESTTVSILHNQQRVPATFTLDDGQVIITLKQPASGTLPALSGLLVLSLPSFVASFALLGPFGRKM